MSAFLHTDIVFDSIAETLSRWTCSADYEVKHAAERALEIVMTDARRAPHQIDWPEDRAAFTFERFAEDLQRANVASVNYRYPDAADRWNPEGNAGAYKCKPGQGKALSPVALAKILHSVRYQSCEPRDWDESPIAKELEALIAEVHTLVVVSLPEYDTAQWSF